jgi:LAO/AO transport system kinase
MDRAKVQSQVAASKLPVLNADLAELLEKAEQHEKWPLARLISLFERNLPESRQVRHELVTYMDAHPGRFAKRALVVGFTGTPGAGKSSLIGEVCLQLLPPGKELAVAVLAVDPSSEDSGGALLGDRTRMNFPVHDKRLFFRSQASALDLGGMGQKTFQVVRLLRYFFDFVFIETVGIGQNEVEVRKLSDHTILVMQPLAGDQVQFMKAGIMEVPDTFVINKCDEESLARKSYHLLKSSLKLMHITLEHNATDARNVFLTSAAKHRGIEELASFISGLGHRSDIRQGFHQREEFYLRKWIRQEFGQYGIRVYEKLAGSRLAALASYEEKEQEFSELMVRRLPDPATLT